MSKKGKKRTRKPKKVGILSIPAGHRLVNKRWRVGKTKLPPPAPRFEGASCRRCYRPLTAAEVAANGNLCERHKDDSA